MNIYVEVVVNMRQPLTPPDLEILRRRVRAIERGTGPDVQSVLSLGVPLLDEALPGGGLLRAAVHEILPERTEWDDGSTAGFTLALTGRLQATAAGPVLWIAKRGDLYAPGLPAFGVDPDRLLMVRAGDDAGVLWAMEEGLRCSALAGVVGEVGHLDRTAARRLQLAAEAGGVMGLTLLRRRVSFRGRQDPSAAVTRWQVGALPEGHKKNGALESAEPGTRWRLELLRCRGGLPVTFEVEWNDATGDFALATTLRDGTASSGTRSAGPNLRFAG